MKSLILLLVVASIATALGAYRLGVRHGKSFGYALCVSESDDDHPKTRTF